MVALRGTADGRRDARGGVRRDPPGARRHPRRRATLTGAVIGPGSPRSTSTARCSGPTARSRTGRAALAAARDAGIDVVLVTARSPRSVREIAADLGLGGIALCANGATIYDLDADGSCATVPLSVDVAHRVVRGCASSVPGIAFAWELELRFGSEPGYEALAATRLGGRGPRARSRRATRSPGREPMTKLLARIPVPTSTRVLEDARALRRRRGGDARRGDVRRGDGTRRSKEAALAELADERGVSSGEVVAFGDQLADAGMLRWAGLGVAVANAPPFALEAADEVTASNDEDGVALVLERLASVGETLPPRAPFLRDPPPPPRAGRRRRVARRAAAGARSRSAEQQRVRRRVAVGQERDVPRRDVALPAVAKGLGEVGASGARAPRRSFQISTRPLGRRAARSVATRMMLRMSSGRRSPGPRRPGAARPSGTPAPYVRHRARVICELPPVIAPMTFVAITPPGVRRSRISSTNSSVEVEGDAVRVEGVDHDHVVLLVVALQEPAAVVDLDVDARVAREREPLVGRLDDLGSSSTVVISTSLKSRQIRFGTAAPPSPTTRTFFASGLYASPTWR